MSAGWITLRTLCGCERRIKVSEHPGIEFRAMLITPGKPIDWTSDVIPPMIEPVRQRVFRMERFVTSEGAQHLIYVEQWHASHRAPIVDVSRDIVQELDSLRAENKNLTLMNESLRNALDGVIGASIDIVKDIARGKL